MFEEVLAAIQASANWCGVPVASLTRDQYRAALKNDVHQVSDSVIRELGAFRQIVKAAAAQEDFSTDTAAELWKLRRQLVSLRKERKALMDRLGQAEAIIGYTAEIGRLERSAASYSPVIRKNKRTAAAVAILSDLHVEETVDPASVEGVNSFDLNEAGVRLERLFEGIEWMIRHHRNAYHIDTLVLGLLGDLISGYIHDELVEINGLSPTEAIVWLTDRIIPGIEFLIDELKLKKVVVPCCFGNHGRMTKKTHISTVHKNNLELFVYDSVRRHFKNDDRVDVYIAKGEILYVDLWGFTLRFTHGDSIKGGSGPIGPIAPAIRKIAAWDKTREADVTVMGHFHRYTCLPSLVINGSLIGFGPYAQHIGAMFEEPAQAFFLVDAERGKTFDAPIWVRELT